MILVLVFGVALLIAVLISGVAARSVLSTSLLFLVAGAVVGDGLLGWIHVTPDSGIVSDAADLALFTVLPAAVALSLLGRTVDRTELFTAAWFGPKGFASVVYGLLVLHSGTPEAEQVYGLIAVTIALSIVVRSSTDIPVARLFRSSEPSSADEARPSEPAG